MTDTTAREGSGLPNAAARAPGADLARRRWLMLAVLVAGQFMALLDVTIVNVAIQTIRVELGASGAALQLVVSGYIITYAMLLITGARLGAQRGPRAVFVTGVAVFTTASLVCGLAPGTGVLIAARFVQGAGAAMMVPQVISVIQLRFSGAERARALGVYAATLAVGAATGLVLGGILVSADLLGTSWRPAFLVNVPVGVALMLLAPRLIPSDRLEGRHRLDLAGLATGSLGILLVVLPLVLGHEQGWPAWTWASLAAGVVVLGVFVAVERVVAARGGDPLLKLHVLRAPGMTAGMSALTVFAVSWGGFLFSLGLHLQAGLGESPLRAGLTFAPAALAFGTVGYFWRRLPGRIHNALVPAGFLLTAVVNVVLAVVLSDGTRGGMLLPLLLMVSGAGMGAAFSPLVTQSLVRVPLAEAPDASGVLTTTMQLMQAVGVATFGSLFLNLASTARPDASAVAISTTFGWLAAFTLAGVVGGLTLARTVHAATRTAVGASEA